MNFETLILVDLGRRLDRLERENKWLKAGLFVSAMILSACFLLGAQGAKEKTLEAEQIILRDGEGKIRVDLNGRGPHLKLLDDKEVIRAELFGDHLKFFNGKEKTRAQLFSDHLKFFDDKEVTRAEVFWSHLRFFDQREKPRVELDGQIPRMRLLGGNKVVYTTPDP